MPGSFIPPTPINISYVGTSSVFMQTATQQLQFLTDKTNPFYKRYMNLTQDGLYLQVDTASVFISKANLFAAAVNALAFLTWPPIINTQPADYTATHPASASFSISASAETSIAYQWYSSSFSQSLVLSSSKLIDNAEFSGSTTAALTCSVTNYNMMNSQFFCTATNVSGQTTSSAAFLTVL